LGEILAQVEDIIHLDDDTLYKQVTVKLHGKGAILRQVVSGTEIKTKRQFHVRSGQLVYSRIDARLGAVAIVPDELDGAIVSNDFPVFNFCVEQIEPRFLQYYSRTSRFLQQCDSASSGTTKRTRIKETDFLRIEIPLPPLDEQCRLVAKLDALATRVEQIRTLQKETEKNIHGILTGAYKRITQNVPQKSMIEIAPLVRRQVTIDPEQAYPELGLRSYGKGTFHKPAIKGSELGGKRIYRIEAGDLMFSNVFAWEGAVAVAQPEDHSRYGSHRFMSRVPEPGVIRAKFLYFHFMTEAGRQQLRDASPGSAGRNRTLGLSALDMLKVPVPPYKAQLWFDAIYDKLDALKRRQAQVHQEMEALMPCVLDRAFRGEL